MFWLNRHERFRKNLSAYVDGALAPDDVRAIEAHVSGCEACRTEVDILRAIAAAVRQLPAAEPPRSFALTPAMLEQRAPLPSAPAAPRFAASMRLASAAVAVVLTVVVIGDLSSAGNGNGGDEGAPSGGFDSAMQSRNSAPADGEAGGDAAEDAAPPAAATEGIGLDLAERGAEATTAPISGTILVCPSSDAGEGGGTGTGAIGAAPASTPTPTPEGNLDAQVDGGTTVEPDAAACIDTTARTAAESPAANAPAIEDESAGEAATGALSEDGADGVSTLRVTEIVLAGALIALLTAIAIDYALRRCRAA